MDTFFVLVGLSALLAFIAGPVAYIRARSISARLGEVETRLRASETTVKLLELRLMKLVEQGQGPSPAEPAAASPWVASPAPEEPVAKDVAEDTVEADASAAGEPAASDAVAAEPDLPPAVMTPDMPGYSEHMKQAIAEARAELIPASPPPPSRTWEERFGARWSVIVGGLALAIGLLMIVRVAIEAGLFGPAARVVIGLMISAALVAGGEWLRRRELAAETPSASPLPGAISIPAALTAAGTVGAFGALYAAHALYGMIGQSVAFVLLGAAGIAGMMAALLHGQALAAVGLIGSFATPILVASNQPKPWPLLVYIAIVAASAYWLARTQRWLWLAMAAAAGSAFWAFVLSVGFVGDRATIHQFLPPAALNVVLHLVMALYVFAWPYRGAPLREPAKEASIIPAAFAFIAVLMLGIAAQNGAFGVLWVLTAVAVAGLLAFAGAGITPAAALLAVAGVFVAALTRVWPSRADLIATSDPVETFFTVWIEPASPMALLAIAGLLALGVFALAADRLRKSDDLPSWAALAYAATGAATPVGVLGLIWLRQPFNPPQYQYAAFAGALAVLYAATASVFQKLPADRWDSPGKLGVGFFTTGALASLALGLTIALDAGHLTVALALTALAAAWISVKEDVPALRWCVAAIGLGVAARLAWDPRIVGDSLSKTPVFNWLLVGYGVPALSFIGAARLLRRDPEDVPQQAAQALAIVFSALLCFFEIRHALNDGNPFAHAVWLAEFGLHACTGLAFACGLTKLTSLRKSAVINVASLVFGFATMAFAAVFLLAFFNPFFDNAPVSGGVFVNVLLIAYALPAILATVLARLSIGRRPEPYRLAAACTAILFGFTYVNLQTRRFFHEALIADRVGFTDGEIYTYSAVWLVLGLALLAYGVAMRSREARIGSAALVVAATVKIFLIDISGLDGILRALSFIGLGFVLIGIGFVYQKLLFIREPGAPAADKPAD